MPDDILHRLQVPLPYNLAGMNIKELRDERREAADEIERLLAEVQFWRTTAWKAIENTDKALTIIELHKALKVELEKAITL